VKQIATLFLRPSQLKLVADPIREYIVSALIRETKTVSQLAHELNCSPTRLYHHVERLVKGGLIAANGQRRVRGLIETAYRTRGKKLRKDLDAFKSTGRSAGEGLKAIVAYSINQARAEVFAAARRGRIAPEAKGLTPKHVAAVRVVARLSPSEAKEMYRKMLELYFEMERLSLRPAPANAEMFSLSQIMVPIDPASQRLRRGTAAKKGKPA
jgi:DNA-binding transcriptional ArsR family regulator